MDKTPIYAMSYGVYVVTSLDGDRPVGCVANSAMQITSKPPTVAVSVNHDNYTNGCIAKSGMFSLTVMAEDSDPTIVGTFGYSSSADSDKFADVKHSNVAGLEVLDGGIGTVICKVIDTMESSTHTVFLGEVIETSVNNADAVPMTYRYYREVLKGKTPKNAPTYQGGDKAAEPIEKEAPVADGTIKKWKCPICGYIFEGENPPASCPLCGVPGSSFVLVED